MTTIEMQQPQAVTTERWTPDRSRTTVEFEVEHWWGLSTVTGHFDSYSGSYAVGAEGPTIELTIDAASVDTGNKMRDKHLRSADFFDTSEHPQVRFTSSRIVETEPGRWHISGDLEAADTVVPLDFDASVQELDDELEIEATTTVDPRELGMSRGPLRNIQPPAKLHVRARLVREESE